MATLRELLQNLPKEHEFELMHKEEEHDIATFVENPLKAFNNLMLDSYADVLDAPAAHLMGSSYYIEIWDIDSQRVESFQFACAGYIGSIDWDKAHIDEDDDEPLYSPSEIFEFAEYDQTLSTDKLETFIHRHAPTTIQFNKKDRILRIDSYSHDTYLNEHEIRAIAAMAQHLGWLEQ